MHRKDRANWVLLNPAHLEDAWKVCAPWIIQAIGCGDQWGQIADIKDGIARGFYHLWAVQSTEDNSVLAVFVTEPQVVGNAKTLVIRWMGGREIENWLDDLAVVERWAQRNDFAAVEIWGRPGWSRRFAPHGYSESFRVISKRIGKELH